MKDLVGTAIYVGDEVAIVVDGKLEVATVVKLLADRVKVRYMRTLTEGVQVVNVNPFHTVVPK